MRMFSEKLGEGRAIEDETMGKRIMLRVTPVLEFLNSPGEIKISSPL